MLHRRLSLTFTTLLLAAAPAAFAAGTVQVSFIDPAHFSDAGTTAIETERNTQVLAEALQRLGRRLPDGQQLKVEVLDVDLAGTVRPGGRGDVRVLRGGADWPSLRLRYTLSAGGQPLLTGEESIADLDYLSRPTPAGYGGNLPYEQRLLARWFDERIAGAQAQ